MRAKIHGQILNRDQMAAIQDLSAHRYADMEIATFLIACANFLTTAELVAMTVWSRPAWIPHAETLAAPRRVDARAAVNLDWHNARAQMLLELNDALDAAPDDHARAALLARLEMDVERSAARLAAKASQKSRLRSRRRDVFGQWRPEPSEESQR